MSKKGNKLCISRLRGIWESGYRKTDLIIMTLPEGYPKHTNKDRRFLRTALCVHSLPSHGQHHASSCIWQIFPSLQRPKLHLGCWWDRAVMALSGPQPAVFQNVRGQRPPKCMKHKGLWEQGSWCLGCGLWEILPGLGPSWMFLSLLSPNRMQTCRERMSCCGQECQKDMLR